ncbi:nimA, partial [Drosophila busckii]
CIKRRSLPLCWLLLLQLSHTRSQNSSLRVNTHLKEIEALPSIQAAGNICTREEPYVEHLEIPEIQPVRVRTTSWCLEIPPRCASYKTEMREVMRVQKLNKTRLVRFCCQGYEGNLSDSQASCKPICRGGCGRGSCLTPDNCSCEEGYTGKHCTQRCDHDRWGLDCKNVCQCQNDAVCDNKTGNCHCIAGWAGQFCEQPCPPGTHGVMCRKGCQCSNKLCHPQTGDCIAQEHAGALNVSHVVLATINSTMANLTHNINSIARRIGSMSEVSHEAVTPSALPEVIVIKQPLQEATHTPKIIVHQSGNALLENLHSAAGSPDVIHVITNAAAGTAQDATPQLNLAGFAAGETNLRANQESSLLSTLVIILLVLMIALTVGFLYVYRRYHLHKDAVVYSANGHISHQAAAGNPEVVLTESANVGKIFHEPLPKPPAKHAQTIEVPTDLYDTPSNNSSIKTPPYAYARKESMYSIALPKSRKGSLDSHLYDEIRYHQQQQHHQHHHHHQQQLHHSHHHQQQQQQPQQQRYQHSTTAAAYLPPASSNATHHHGNGHPSPHVSASSHVTHLIIPPQNKNFLQVPTQITTQKIAHL